MRLHDRRKLPAALWVLDDDETWLLYVYAFVVG